MEQKPDKKSEDESSPKNTTKDFVKAGLRSYRWVFMNKVNRPIFLVLNVLCSSNGQKLGTGFSFGYFLLVLYKWSAPLLSYFIVI